MQIIYYGDEMPETFNKSLFLAGGSLRPGQEGTSWREDAIKILEDIGYDGVVFCPENEDGKFDEFDELDKDNYSKIVEWENKYLALADCIMFWVPRDLSLDEDGNLKLACLTTNVEYGMYCDRGNIVFGAPKDADKVSYLKYYADKYNVPVNTTLTATLESALQKIGDGADRTDGERYVPLFIWQTEAFQNWYQTQKKAGNVLENATLLYNFRPQYKNFVFLWILKVSVYITSEKRSKTNEFVLARTDISSVLLWHKTLPLENSQVVLIKEFRSPARTEDGFIHELPSGSSHKQNVQMEEIASEEIFEETGMHIDTERFKFHEARQLAGTLSSHKSFFYSVELTEEEINWFKSQKDVAHGKEEDTERTFVEVYTVKELLSNVNIDWTTLGQVFSAYYRTINEELT